MKLPKCHAKNILRKDMMKQQQSEWDEGDTGRSTFNIFPKVSLHSANRNRADVLFFTEHRPFSSYLHRFHLANSHCVAVEKLELLFPMLHLVYQQHPAHETNKAQLRTGIV
ncbi:hypothetical protein AVEN_272895-1 [Araneus ventricosus]|uniref:Uncharacterized protein n=1 Tax=Araneus ventricosus TaxID=182803 RepID=A0A4Y2E9H8_ARAVE|nr:hypothetical protein AVEN_272895-1 [Araneus ventricosus]